MFYFIWQQLSRGGNWNGENCRILLSFRRQLLNRRNCFFLPRLFTHTSNGTGFLQLIWFCTVLKGSLETFTDERTHINLPLKDIYWTSSTPHHKCIQEKLLIYSISKLVIFPPFFSLNHISWRSGLSKVKAALTGWHSIHSLLKFKQILFFMWILNSINSSQLPWF